MKSQIHSHFVYRKMGAMQAGVFYPATSQAGWYVKVKRGFDVIISVLVIVLILSWLVPVLAMLIKLNSRGPVFFIQQRVGHTGRMFSCWKFRTMVMNDQADTKQAGTNDPRITSIGKFLRLSCLDEFPQFFNVLVGDMSIIGPRPHMLRDCEEFTKYIPEYDVRHAIKPGITGMAQVKGFRGRTKSVSDIFLRYRWDIFYLRNAGLALDFKILFRTVSQTMKSATDYLKKKKGVTHSGSIPVSPPVAPARYSIVIVAKDAASKIERLLSSVSGLSDDIIVCDTGSADATMAVARKCGARVFSILWEGYGKSKNIAISFAKYDWILSLDSDEKVDADLFQQLHNWNPDNDHTVYQVLWKNFLGKQWIRHSDWRTSWKNRLFNKHFVAWDDAIAHEDVQSADKITFKRIPGYLEHYSFLDKKDYRNKMDNSARLTAIKYFRMHKNSVWLHLVVSPAICFIKTYFLRLGFLDGKNGWLIAATSANYTFKKYSLLRRLNKNRTGKIVHLDTSLLPARVIEM